MSAIANKPKESNQQTAFLQRTSANQTMPSDFYLCVDRHPPKDPQSQGSYVHIAGALYKLGHYASHQGKKSKAYNCFREAVGLYVNLFDNGMIRDGKGKEILDRLVKCTCQMKHLDPENPLSVFKLATALRLKGAHVTFRHKASFKEAHRWYSEFRASYRASVTDPVRAIYWPQQLLSEALYWETTLKTQFDQSKDYSDFVLDEPLQGKETAGATKKRSEPLPSAKSDLSLEPREDAGALSAPRDFTPMEKAAAFVQIGEIGIKENNFVRAVFAFREAQTLYSDIFQVEFSNGYPSPEVLDQLIKLSAYLVTFDPDNASFKLDHASAYLLKARNQRNNDRSANILLLQKAHQLFSDFITSFSSQLVRSPSAPFWNVAFFDAYFGRGVCAEALDNVTEALNDYRTALKFSDSGERTDKVNKQRHLVASKLGIIEKEFTQTSANADTSYDVKNS